MILQLYMLLTSNVLLHFVRSLWRLTLLPKNAHRIIQRPTLFLFFGYQDQIQQKQTKQQHMSSPIFVSYLIVHLAGTHLMMIDTYMKFRGDVLNWFYVTEPT